MTFPFGPPPVAPPGPTADPDVPVAPDPGLPGPFDLFAHARTLLDAVIAGYADRDVPLPPFAYVGGGSNVAYDGEQVTVNAQRIAAGKPDMGAGGMPIGFMEQSAQFAVAVVRSFPIAQTPDVTSIEAAAAKNAADIAALWSILVGLRDHSAWPVGRGGSLPFSITEVRAEGPQGGLVAAVGILAVTLV